MFREGNLGGQNISESLFIPRISRDNALASCLLFFPFPPFLFFLLVLSCIPTTFGRNPCCFTGHVLRETRFGQTAASIVLLLVLPLSPVPLLSPAALAAHFLEGPVAFGAHRPVLVSMSRACCARAADCCCPPAASITFSYSIDHSRLDYPSNVRSFQLICVS